MMFIVRSAIFFLHLAVLLLLLGTTLNAYFSPKWLNGINLLPLSFPFLMFFNIIFSVFWLFSFRKRGLLFLLGWVLVFPLAQRWINYSSPKNKVADVKVMSYNTKGVSDKKKDFLNKQEVDVLLLQESGWGKKDKMKLSNYQYQAHTEIVSVYSKFPILEQKKILLSENGYALYADIKVKNKVVRFINLYLEPFKLDKSMVKPSLNTEINEIKAKSLVSRLLPVFRIHQIQIEEIKSYIENSPYPIVLAGDFNAVPNSYEYYQISNHLKDAFIEVGKGSATTFHDYSFPIRIDYIFSSSDISPIQYNINRDVKLSDHYPIYADFYLKND